MVNEYDQTPQRLIISSHILCSYYLRAATILILRAFVS